MYALAPFALAWTVATPYLFAGQQMQVGRTVTVAFAMVVMATFLFFRYDVHITSAQVRKGDYLAGWIFLHDLFGALATVKVLIGPDSRAYGRMVVCGYQRADVWRYVAGGAAICGDCRYRGA